MLGKGAAILILRRRLDPSPHPGKLNLHGTIGRIHLTLLGNEGGAAIDRSAHPPGGGLPQEIFRQRFLFAGTA